MSTSPVPFYDNLAEFYHFLFDDWDAAIHRQAAVLEPLLAGHLPHRPLRILDCACGIGTQALGFAKHGHDVTATDLSPAAIARAQREAETRGLHLNFFVADMTSLAGVPPSDFDVIAAFDNALPHLGPAQLASTLRAAGTKLRPGGLFVTSLRDYDTLIQQRPTIQPPAFHGAAGQRRIVHQVWDWHRPDSYTVHLYLTLENDGGWHAHHFTSEYRCLLRPELTAALHEAGFVEVQWLMPETSGFYQPIVTARQRREAERIEAPC